MGEECSMVTSAGGRTPTKKVEQFGKKSILGLWQCAVRKQEGKQVFIVKGNMDSKYQTYKGPQGFSSVEIQRTLFSAFYEKKMDKLCIFKKENVKNEVNLQTLKCLQFVAYLPGSAFTPTWRLFD